MVQGAKIKGSCTGNPILWAAGGAVLLGRTLHIVGGFINNGCNNDQSTYHLTLDVDTWLADTTKPAKWMNNLAPLPVKRNHFSTITLGGKIYAIGGQFGHDCGGGLDKQYAHVYNPPTDTWTRLPDLPAPRSHIEGGAFAIDGKIFIVAGQGDSSKSINKVTIFDPAGKNGAGT
ncbi:MAG: kelch repeat-containing protein [Segetibacter sp.]